MERDSPCLFADGATLHGYCAFGLLPGIDNVSNGGLARAMGWLLRWGKPRR